MNNNYTFSDRINFIKKETNVKNIDANDYDGMIIRRVNKQLLQSYKGPKASHQSHYPITSSQMGFFPVIYNRDYMINAIISAKYKYKIKHAKDSSENIDLSKLKKQQKLLSNKASFFKSLFSIQVPIHFYKNDAEYMYLNYHDETKDNKNGSMDYFSKDTKGTINNPTSHCGPVDPIQFKNSVISFYATIKLGHIEYTKSMRNAEKGNDKLSILNELLNPLQIEFDTPQYDKKNYYIFREFKKLPQMDDFLIILKHRSRAEYDLFLVKSDRTKDSTDNCSQDEWNDWNKNFHPINKVDIELNNDVINKDHNLIKFSNFKPILTGGDNEIYYGAPGTGKSYTVNKIAHHDPNSNIIRTTFYPDYDYNDFVGQIMPSVNFTDSNKVKEIPNKSNNDISYNFYKGPFTEALYDALSDPYHYTYLIIEELSRANASAVFGDIFQLLDRDNQGVSRYSINNDYIADYLNANLDNSEKYPDLINNNIRIPGNLKILATMNTNDQNITPLDSAFKRRFSEHYVSVILPNSDIKDNEYASFVANTKLSINTDNKLIHTSWYTFYQYLDHYIAHVLYPKEDSENKQIGMFFMQFTKNSKHNKSQLKNKLLQYLWDDVNDSYIPKTKRIFKPGLSFAEIYKQFGNSQIFSDAFLTGLKKYISTHTKSNDEKNLSEN